MTGRWTAAQRRLVDDQVACRVRFGLCGPRILGVDSGAVTPHFPNFPHIRPLSDRQADHSTGNAGGMRCFLVTKAAGPGWGNLAAAVGRSMPATMRHRPGGFIFL